MKRSTFAFSAAAAALLLCRIAGAQVVVPGNGNDIHLSAPDANNNYFVYTYQDPSPGPAAGHTGTGTELADNFAGNDYLWKVQPKLVMRSCTNTLSWTHMQHTVLTTDGFDTDGSGNNFAIGDVYLSDSVAGVIPNELEPDKTDALGVLVQFGAPGAVPPMAGIMNAALPSAACPPANQLNGFDLEEDFSGAPISVRADGLTDLVITTFQPGGTSQAPGWLGSTCPAGNYQDNDLHCGVANGGIGETNFDDNALNQNQWGGFVFSGVGTGADAAAEGQVIWGGYDESTVQMLLDSGTGNGIEEGRCSYDYDCPAAANVGQLSARIYSFQNIGQRGLVIGSLGLKPACTTLKGAKLAVNIDIVTTLLLKFWSFSPASSIIKLTDNGAVPAVGLPDGFKDGTCDMLIAGVFALPLPAQVVPIGSTVTAFFQGFIKKTGNPILENTQATGCAFHG